MQLIRMIRSPLLCAATTWLLLGAPAVAQEVPVTPNEGVTPQLPDGAPVGMDSILGADLMRRATWLASDALGGRLTGTDEQHRAAQYIAEHFQSLGLKPLGEKADGEGGESKARGYVQKYPVTIRSIDEEQSGLRIDDMAINRHYALIAPRDFEAVDVTGAPLFAAIDREAGSKDFSTMIDSLDDAKDAINYWVERLGDTLQNIDDA